MSNNLSFRAVAVLLTGLFAPSLVFASQMQERVVNKVKAPDEPVSIAKLKLKGVPRGFGQKFTEEEDWLRDLTLSIKNTSNKPIVYIEVELYFPRPESQRTPHHLPFSKRLWFGYYQARLSPLPADAPQRLLPGEKAEIKLDAAKYDSLVATLRELKYPVNIKDVQLSIDFVVFDDDTGWSLGTPVRRDPNKPDRWVNAQDQFRGAA